MTSALEEVRVSIPQRDSRILRVGPIPADDNVPPTLYDASGHTARLVLKTDRWANDITGQTIVGVVYGDLSLGFFCEFLITSAHTALAGERWMRVYIVPPGGQPKTIIKEPILIEPV